MIKKLHEDLKQAMKNKESVKKEVIKSIINSCNWGEKQKKAELSETEIHSIIKSKLKQTKDALNDFEKANRIDLIDLANEEICVLESYLPKQLSNEEIEVIVKDKINELSLDSKNIGAIMKNVMPVIGSSADGNTVKNIILNLK